MTELWKKVTISLYEEKYEISSYGRIRSLHKKIPKILKCTMRSEYLGIQLCNKINATHSIHRLVALAFIPNPNNHKIVNHKNGNKLDNNVDNLEWTTSKENAQHAFKQNLRKLSNIRVSQFTLQGELIKTYESLSQAMRETGIRDTRISSVCKGKRNHTHGFVWKYTDFEWKKINIPEGKEIVGFPNYVITKDGKIFSKSHEKFISARKNAGYEYVTLYNTDKKTKKRTRKDVAVHILMANEYLKNPRNLPYVNHKNYKRSDNNVENLEWCSAHENMVHFGIKNKKNLAVQKNTEE
jgi:hypothetical protein